MDACCAETVAASKPTPDEEAARAELKELGGGHSYTTCICGSTWTWNDAGEPVFYQQERKCVVCGHWSCPCCGDYCDEAVNDEGDEFEMCPCDGTCTYAESAPEILRV